jgi:hypothetical protein
MTLNRASTRLPEALYSRHSSFWLNFLAGKETLDVTLPLRLCDGVAAQAEYHIRGVGKV